ncbi:MAG: hypothetical protein KJ624_07655 [Chloroflexi bacterium]|nr:hypothetical protein [Chloroflexota bacterium]
MDEKIVDALNDCLERLARGEALEAVLSRYPDARRELEPLLKASLVTRKALAGIAPPPGARARVWTHLQPAMNGRSRPRASQLAWLRPWAVAATSLFLVFMLAGGTVLASANSLPHQPLYQVKLAAEQAQLAITPTEAGKARLELALAEKRAREMVAVAQLNRPQDLEKLAERLERHLEKVAGPDVQVAPTSPAGLPSPEPSTEQVADGAAGLAAAPATPSPTPQAALALEPTPTPGVAATPEVTPSFGVSVTPQATPAFAVAATPQPVLTPEVSPVVPTPEPAPTPVAAPSAAVTRTPEPTPTPEVARAPEQVPGPPPQAEGRGEDEKPERGEPEKAGPDRTVTPEVTATPRAARTPEVTATPRATRTPEGAKTAKPEPEKAAKPVKPELEARLEDGARLQDELLEEHLDKVPPEARESLRQALEKNRDNYQKALKRLQDKRDEKDKD